MSNFSILMYLVLFLVLTPTYGADKITVQSVDQDIDLSKMDNKVYDLREGIPKDRRINREPIPSQMDTLFAKAGITKDVSYFDRLEKDLLYGRAKNYPLNELSSYYPKIKKEKLQKLKEVIAND